jgi:hypothetical protein
VCDSLHTYIDNLCRWADKVEELLNGAQVVYTNVGDVDSGWGYISIRKASLTHVALLLGAKPIEKEKIKKSEIIRILRSYAPTSYAGILVDRLKNGEVVND